MAVELGGSAVLKVYSEHNLKVRSKGLTDEGKTELLTRADLVSNHLIMDLLKRYPLMNVRPNFNPLLNRKIILNKKLPFTFR